MAAKKRINKTTEIVAVSKNAVIQTVSVDALALSPEEAVWLASRKSARTRRAYCNDVAHFMRTFNITSADELRKVDHRAVMAWERLMREVEGKEATMVRWRLSALSSLFTHLVKFGVVDKNPVREVKRPTVNRREGMTLAFSQKQARKILDAPPDDTVKGLHLMESAPSNRFIKNSAASSKPFFDRLLDGPATACCAGPDRHSRGQVVRRCLTGSPRPATEDRPADDLTRAQRIRAGCLVSNRRGRARCSRPESSRDWRWPRPDCSGSSRSGHRRRCRAEPKKFKA